MVLVGDGAAIVRALEEGLIENADAGAAAADGKAAEAELFRRLEEAGGS